MAYRDQSVGGTYHGFAGLGGNRRLFAFELIRASGNVKEGLNRKRTVGNQTMGEDI